jgi:NADH:ubiquinone oxidoreductase subunit 3 (subunit A)
VEYAGLVVMLSLGLVLCGALLRLGSRLASAADRRAHASLERPEDCDPSLAVEADDALPEEPETASPLTALASRRQLARHFFAAVLAVVLLTASLYFYIWGVSLAETGLAGFVAVLCFSACLLIGLIYSWSRGAADAMTESDS